MTLQLAHAPTLAGHRNLNAQMNTLFAVFPELGLGLVLFAAARDQLRHRLGARIGEDRERGDAVQWVILAALGAVIAVTVGTIVYNKVTNKANTISTDTPAAGQ